MSNDEQLRPALVEFAQVMEAKLRKNDDKTDWRALPKEALLKKLRLEVQEFEISLEYESSEEARYELVDIANFAMILHDRIQADEDNHNE